MRQSIGLFSFLLLFLYGCTRSTPVSTVESRPSRLVRVESAVEREIVFSLGCPENQRGRVTPEIVLRPGQAAAIDIGREGQQCLLTSVEVYLSEVDSVDGIPFARLPIDLDQRSETHLEIIESAADGYEVRQVR